ncbi:MAG: ABC transporter permease [Gemmataceae bacterium]
MLFGMAFSSGLAYWLFVGTLSESGAVREPIVRLNLGFEILAAIQAMFLVPALTMRQFSEEKRTGTLEVLLTAPVNEGTVVLSKFLGCWVFYMLCWLPAGLYLIALRVVGGAPFDYLPLLSYYLALAVSGAAFLSMGLFFSSLTSNQVIAAVLTFAGMMFLLLTFVIRQMTLVAESVNAALSRFDFLSQWRQALSGQLSVPDVLVYASLATFGLFLTVKVLETRRWA